MRRARLTYKGAYHHVMNRGYDGNPIFKGRKDKEDFLSLLKLYSEKLNIRIFAYCLMDNHYHLILENSSGRMSDFLKKQSEGVHILFQHINTPDHSCCVLLNKSLLIPQRFLRIFFKVIIGRFPIIIDKSDTGSEIVRFQHT